MYKWKNENRSRNSVEGRHETRNLYNCFWWQIVSWSTHTRVGIHLFRGNSRASWDRSHGRSTHSGISYPLWETLLPTGIRSGELFKSVHLMPYLNRYWHLVVATKMGRTHPTGLLFLLPPANEVYVGYVFTHVCLSTGGVLSQHALQVVSQHALQQISIGSGIPACPAGFQAHTQEGSWGGSGQGGVSRPRTNAEVKGIWPGGGGLQASTHPTGMHSCLHLSLHFCSYPYVYVYLKIIISVSPCVAHTIVNVTQGTAFISSFRKKFFSLFDSPMWNTCLVGIRISEVLIILRFLFRCSYR